MEDSSGFQGIRRGGGRRGVGVAVRGQRSWWGWKCSVSWQYQCQYPGCDTVLLLFYSVLPSGETV